MDQNVTLGNTVTLDGSQSYDEEGDSLVFLWAFDTIPAESGLLTEDLSANNSPEASTTSFVPDVEGIYSISLKVNDGMKDSDYDYVVINVYVENIPPVAEAGANLSGTLLDPVTLDGTESYDADGDFLAYRWSFVLLPQGSTLTDADLYNQGTPNAIFVPDLEGVYVLSLVVSDGRDESDPDYVAVTISSGNLAPVADAGEGDIVTPCEGNTVYLDGTGSYDPEGDPITYTWRVILVPSGSSVSTASLSDPTSDAPYFTADVAGLYVVQLVVDDGLQESDPDSVAIMVTDDADNDLPVASAGADQAVSDTVTCTSSGYTWVCPDCDSITLTLDGSGSYDPDQDPITYSWAVTSGTASISDATLETTEITLPELSTSYGSTNTSTVVITLSVSDCFGTGTSDSLTITYSCTGGS